MAEARYAMVETATSIVFNLLVIDDEIEDDFISPVGTFIVKVDESVADEEKPMLGGTYNSSTKKLAQLSCFPLTFPEGSSL